jgi:ATP-dependent Clp protease ATP-binding subunit ClpA
MLARSVEKTLNEIFESARSEGTEFVGTEHLLFGLLSDAKCRGLLESLGANIEDVKDALRSDIAAQSRASTANTTAGAQPTLGFQRVLQGAVLHTQYSGSAEVSSLIILMSLFNEQESAAVSILSQQGIERGDLLEHLGEPGWEDVHIAISAPPMVGMRSFSYGLSGTRSISESRLSDLENKLDDAIEEIRYLANIVNEFLERLPPRA